MSVEPNSPNLAFSGGLSLIVAHPDSLINDFALYPGRELVPILVLIYIASPFGFHGLPNAPAVAVSEPVTLQL